MSSEQLVEFTNLKRKIHQAAAETLAGVNPNYVHTFRRRLEETRGDLERVIDETRPLLGEAFRDWPDVLTAVLDVELVLDKVKRSLAFLRTDVGDTPEEDGAKVVYHVDHWILQMDALLERFDKLVALVFRRVVRPKDREWQTKERALRHDIKKMKVEIAKRRDPLAHGLGGGVTGIQEDFLWEPGLASNSSDVDLVASLYHQVGPRRERWHSYLEQTTVLALAAIEAISAKLSGHVT
jgi:hypothetical protein